MEKIQAEVEGLMEEILDEEAETGESNPLASRFVNILTRVQEDAAAQRIKEERNKLKGRLCDLLDQCPELKVDLGTVNTLEQMALRGEHYRGILGVRQLIAGEGALDERVERDGDLAHEALAARGIPDHEIEAHLDDFQGGLEAMIQPVADPRQLPPIQPMPAGMRGPAAPRINQQAAARAREQMMRDMLAAQARGHVIFNGGGAA